MVSTTATQSKHRWYRFSIRALLLLVLLLSLPLAYFSNWIAAKRREIDVAQRFEGDRGHLLYARDWSEPVIQEQLERIFPRDYLYSAWRLKLADATDARLPEFRHFRQLAYLDLSHSKITDAGLLPLRSLRSLQVLELNHTEIGDQGFANFSANQRLHSLCLIDTKITDASLARMKHLHVLQSLWLSHTSITDAGVAELAGLPELTAIDLAETRVTSRMFKSLKRMPKLVDVYLQGTAIDDSAIPDICRMTRLQSLDLRETKLTPAGQVHLRKQLPRCQFRFSEHR